MSKDPAFLFYSNDFDQGTKFFTDEQTGKYIRLLIAQHQHGHLPEKHMLFICKSYDKDIFSKFIQDINGLYYNERLENETIKRKKYSESRSKNRKDKNICKSYDEHMENENENINKDKNKGVNKNDLIVIFEAKILYDEFINSETWLTYILTSQVATEKKIEKPELVKLITKYIEEQRIAGTMNRSLSEYKRHFFNWFKKYLTTYQPAKKPNYVG